MPTADVSIGFSVSTPAFAYPVGAKSDVDGSAVSASSTANDIAVNTTGAAVTGQVGQVLGPYIPIVPGLYTFGTDMTAGRGSHTIVKVTNTDDSGAGSLREALTTGGGNKVVVFETSGLCSLNSTIRTNLSNIIIAGQTAPAPGFMTINNRILFEGNNVLVQHLHCAGGDATELIGDEGDAVGVGTSANNLVFDHCTIIWGHDETFSVWAWLGAININNVSCTNSILGEGLFGSQGQNASRGPIVGRHPDNTIKNDNFSFVKCLIMNNWQRSPFTENVVLCNNFVYNWRQQASEIRGKTSGSAVGKGSMVGCYHKKGPAHHPDPSKSNHSILLRDLDAGSQIYLDDNDADYTTVTDQWADIVRYAGTNESNCRSNTRVLWPDGLTAMPVAQVQSYVTTNAGAFPQNRIATETRMISEAQNGTNISPDSSGLYPYQIENPPMTGADIKTVDYTDEIAALGSYNDIQVSGYSKLEEWLHGFLVSIEP